jgi:hypothetical protein
MYDDFFVLDPTTSARVPGITSTGFTRSLHNPSNTEVSGSIAVSIAELGNGDYRLSYTPDTKGLWKVSVFHAIYFSAGKTNNHQIYNVDIDSIYTDLGTVNDKVDALVTSTGHISTTADSVLNRVNTIPTNPMLNSEDGSSFDSIPNMAKESTVISAYTSTGSVLTAGFNTSAKETTLLEVQTSTGHISVTVDEILASSTGATINKQDIRDAMKLSPSTGASATDSIDAKLDEILATSSGAINPQAIRDAMKLAPSSGSPAVSSIDDKLNILQASTGYVSDSVDILKSDTTTIINNQAFIEDKIDELITSTGHISEVVDSLAISISGISTDMAKESTLMIVEDKLDDLITSTGHISQVVDEIEIDADLIQNIHDDLAIVDGKVNGLITSTGNIRNAVSAIPTNPMLDTETGSSFTAIPNMALDSTVAKETSLTDIKGTGFATNTDSLVNLSHGDIEITEQMVSNALKLAPAVGVPANGSVYDLLNTIPTNPMLDIATGSTFTSIPDMAKNSTVAKSTELTALDTVIDAGFVAGAKETTITSGFSAGAKEATLNTADDKIDALIVTADHIHVVVDEIDAILAGVYLGDRTITIRIKDDQDNSLGDVSVQLWGTDLTNLVTYGFTGSNGEMVRTVNDGVYKVKVRKNGYQFNDPFDLTITADTSVEYTGTTYIIGPAEDLDLCRLYGYIVNGSYEPIEGVSICAVPYDSPTIIETSTAMTVVSPETVEAITTSTGEFAIDLLRNVKFTVSIPEIGFRETIIVPNETGPVTLWSLTDLFISGDPEKNDPNW